MILIIGNEKSSCSHIMSVTLSLQEELGCVCVSVSGGDLHRYPYIWLRDNCECSKCRIPNFKNQRKVTPLDLDMDIQVSTCKLSADQESVEVAFSDDHQGSFRLDWLEKNHFSKDRGPLVRERGGVAPVSWGKELENNIHEADYDKVLENDEALVELICAMEERGIAVLTGAPKQHGVLEKLTARMGNVSSTFFAPGPACMKFFLDKEAEYDLIAYTSKTLHMHTDVAFATAHPVIQYLQAICQPEGVINQFVDGRKIVEVLREQYPEDLHLLSTVDVEHVGNYTGQYTFRAASLQPIIRLDSNGEFLNINYSCEFRASGIGAEVEDIKPFYRALKTFMKLTLDNAVDQATPEGNIFIVDNSRVMHGRVAFTLQSSCHRHLEVAYTDLDAMMSTKRLILEKHNK